MKVLMEMGETYHKFFQALPSQLQKAGSNVSCEVIQHLDFFKGSSTLKVFSQKELRKPISDMDSSTER